MNIVRIRKAQDVIRGSHLPDMTIEMVEEVQSEGKTLEEMQAAFEADAGLLALALKDILPGGTLVRLTAELLKHQANLFVVTTN